MVKEPGHDFKPGDTVLILCKYWFYFDKFPLERRAIYGNDLMGEVGVDGIVIRNGLSPGGQHGYLDIVVHDVVDSEEFPLLVEKVFTVPESLVRMRELPEEISEGLEP